MKHIITIVILVVIVGGGVWLLLRQAPEELIMPQETELSEKNDIKEGETADTSIDSAQDWQTYRNEEYGFKIAYPSEFIATSQGPNYVQQAIDRGEQISGTVQPSYDTIIFSDGQNELGKIEIFHEYKEDIIEENYKDEGYLYLYGPCDVRWGFKLETINSEFINDIDMLMVKGDSQACYYLKNPTGNLIMISNKGYKPDIFDQMLSTFRFVEAIKISKYIKNSFNLDDKTFDVITTEEKTIKVSVSDNTKFYYKTSSGDQPGSIITKYENFSQFVEERKGAYDGEYVRGGFDETIRGIFLNDSLIEADEIFWWVQ